MARDGYSVCVYCGSRFGADPVYREVAKALGEGIAERNWRLIYGAGDVGLMGTVATACMSSGGEAVGVIPTHLFEREVGKRDISHLIVTETMHERKKVMFMNADAVVVLPGGAGSLDEFFEVLTWAQLGLQSKPIVLLNAAGYWTPLVQLLEHVVAHGFADASLLTFMTVTNHVEDAFAALAD